MSLTAPVLSPAAKDSDAIKDHWKASVPFASRAPFAFRLRRGTVETATRQNGDSQNGRRIYFCVCKSSLQMTMHFNSVLISTLVL